PALAQVLEHLLGREAPAVLAARAQEANGARVGQPLDARLSHAEELRDLARGERPFASWRSLRLVRLLLSNIFGDSGHTNRIATIVGEGTSAAAQPAHPSVWAANAELHRGTRGAAQGLINLCLHLWT